MAQFKSSSREGSFENNLLIQPDTISKIREEGKRRLANMDAHQQALEKQRSALLEAQKTGQNVQSRNAKRAFDVQQDATNAAFTRDKELWNLQLKREEARNKFKVDKLGALVDFSKTAVSITNDIVKYNKENQQRAVKQLAYKHSVTTDTLRNIAALDEGMNFSAFQQSAYAQQLIKNDATADEIKFQFDHLYKGNGFKNYVDNAYVLKTQAAKVASTLYADIDPNLSVEETQKEITRRTVRANDQVKINGIEPRVEMLEKHWYPSIREAERKALQGVNKKIRDKVADSSLNTQVAAARNAYNPGNGSKNPRKLLDLFAIDPTKDNRTVMLKGVANDPATNIGDLRTLLSTPFEFNGQTWTLRDYPEEAAILENRITELEREEKEDAAEELVVKKLEIEVLLQQKADEGAPSWTQDRQDELKWLAEDGGGPGYSAESKTVQAMQKYVIDGPTGTAAEEFMERHRKRVQAGTATRESVKEMGLPAKLEIQALQQIATMEGLRATPQYSDAINNQIKNSVLNATGLKYKFGAAVDPSVLWKIEKSKAAFKRYVVEFSITNPENAVQMALDKVITDNVRDLKEPGAVEQSKITEYYTYLNTQQKAQEEAKAERDRLSAVSTLKDKTKRSDPKIWAEALNTETLIEQVQVLQTYGDSQYLRSLGALMKPNAPRAPWEVIEFLAPAVEGVEPIDAPRGWKGIVQFVDDQDRYVLFSTDERESTQAAKLRVLQGIKARAQNGTNQELAVRPVFDTGEIDIDTFINAIAGNESGGESDPQRARNDRTNASGRTQIHPDSLERWSKDILGREVTPAELRESPQIQDLITRTMLGRFLKQEMDKGYTGELLLRRVASEWYSGDPDLYDNPNGQGPSGTEPSVLDYTTDILGRYKSSFSQAPNVETGQNRGIIVTSAIDPGEKGTDYVISNGQRGAKFYFPVKSKVIEVVRDQNWETNLENNPNGRRGYGNYVDVETDFGNGIVADARIAHFDDVANLGVGQQIPAGTFLGTQGRTGSTTGAHISIDWYYPGTNTPYPEARDYYLNNYLRKN